MADGEFTFEKFNDQRKAKYLNALRRGVNRTNAYRLAGVSNAFVCAYRKAHPEWAELETEAELQANGSVENALFKAAMNGNVTACQVWLYNRSSDRWKDQRNLNIRKNIEDMSDEELLAIAAGGRAGVGPKAGPDSRPAG